MDGIKKADIGKHADGSSDMVPYKKMMSKNKKALVGATATAAAAGAGYAAMDDEDGEGEQKKKKKKRPYLED
jgi:hypothetical protein